MMTDDATNERAERGREILKSRSAQGEPGTKQPAHKGPAVEAQQVVDDIRALTEKHSVETRGPSAEETQNHPVPPEERTTSPIVGGGIQAAAGALDAARSHIETELIAEARRTSDPRFEQDQKKFEMGQRGELAFLPPASRDEIENPPTTPQEQVDRDAAKLDAATETAKQVRGAQVINPTVDTANSVKDSQIRTGTGKPGPAATGEGTDTSRPTTSESSQSSSTASTEASPPATPAERASSPAIGGLREASSPENTPPSTGTPIR